MAPNPHDLLVRSWLSVPSEAAAFFRLFLPAALRQAVDLRRLWVVPGTFIESRLRESITDILFETVIAGRKTLIYLLLEHQSSIERWMPLRLDLYVRRIWEAYRERHPEAKTLPLIIPIVLYHGHRPWSGPRSLRELIDLPEDPGSGLAAFLPALGFVLVDLSTTPDEVLRTAAVEGTARAALSLLFLKHARAPGFRRRIAAWQDLFRAVLEAPHGWDAFRRLVSYVFLVRDDLVPEDFADVLTRVAGPEAKEVAMTIAERLIKQGQAEGRTEASRDNLRRLLEARFGPARPEMLQRLAAADLPRLDAWFERALTATTLASVFEDGPPKAC